LPIVFVVPSQSVFILESLPMGDESRALLSWVGAQLTQRELDILSSSQEWLNDAVITFWFEYLSRFVVSGNSGEGSGGDTVILVSAESTFWLGMESDLEEVQAALDNLGVSMSVVSSSGPSGANQASSTVTVLFPMNDNVDPSQANAGSHWSLLMLRFSCCSSHPTTSPAVLFWTLFDSGQNSYAGSITEAGTFNMNTVPGRFARKISESLMAMREQMLTSNPSRTPDGDLNVDTGPGPSLRLKYAVCREMPTQANLHDCGVYVATVAERIAASTPSTRRGSESAADMFSLVAWLQRDLTPELVVSKRLEMLQIAQTMIEKGGK